MIRVVLPALVLSVGGAQAEPLRPAEMPPAAYRGLQYVDSKGCMFVRAGNGTEVLWIPRVSRQGVPICGNPPSGQRVPVVEDVGVQPLPAASDDVSETRAFGGFFVDIGSFSQSDAAGKAEARVTGLSFGVVRGRVNGGDGATITVFAGPFPDAGAAEAARRTLRDAGFAAARLVEP